MTIIRIKWKYFVYRLKCIPKILFNCSRGKHQPVFGFGSAMNFSTGKTTTWADENWSCLYCGKNLGDNW